MPLTVHTDHASSDGLANGVPCFAHVGTGIFRVSVEDVESDVSKIVGGFKFMPLRDGTSVSEPLDDHCRVVDGCQRSFEVSILAFRQVFNVLERSAEGRLLGDDLVLLGHALISRVVLEVLYLLQRALVLRVADNRCSR